MHVSRQFEMDKEEITPDDEFKIEFVKCEICFEIIGRVDLVDFEAPMSGKMFLSKSAKHDYPPPFIGDVEWQFMQCPYCHRRPFVHQHKFLNDRDEWCGYSFDCDECGKFYKTKFALIGHKGRSHGK